ELVSIADATGKQQPAILSRADIAAALGAEPAQWRQVTLRRDHLIEALRRTRYGTAENPGKAEYAELFLRGCIVHKRYSLADLGARDARELLQRFFEKRGGVGAHWWIRKIPPRSEEVDENGLIALLKELGFEATRSGFAPVLFVRPPFSS
ncbi:MAG TPA: hypothetical protein VM680_03935, partial [Verrucomicrobiae bacterium]|nr:hypothetical protein [Verrucomicrobiae bacterium]